MKNMAAFRITALSCFFFALVSLLSPFKDSILPTAVTAGLILIAAFLAVQVEKPWLRLVFFIIPLTWIALVAIVDWPKLALTAGVCAVPVIVAALTVAFRLEGKELWRQRREFLILTAASALLLVICLNPLIFSLNTIIFVAAYLLLGVLALRAGRAGRMVSTKWQAGSAALLLVPIVCAAGVGTGLMVGFDALMEWLKNLFADTGMPVAKPTSEPMQVDSWIKLPPVNEMAQSSAVPLDHFEDKPETPNLIKIEGSDWHWILLAVVLVLALVILLVLLLGNKNKEKPKEEGLEMAVEDEVRTKSRRRWRRRSKDESNAEKVRELYRQYLAYLKVKGVSFDQSETSQDVSEDAKAVLGDDEVFREIYRKARYDKEGTITDEELAQAQAAYQRLINPPKEEQAEEASASSNAEE